MRGNQFRSHLNISKHDGVPLVASSLESAQFGCDLSAAAAEALKFVYKMINDDAVACSYVHIKAKTASQLLASHVVWIERQTYDVRACVIGNEVGCLHISSG